MSPQTPVVLAEAPASLVAVRMGPAGCIETRMPLTNTGRRREVCREASLPMRILVCVKSLTCNPKARWNKLVNVTANAKRGREYAHNT